MATAARRLLKYSFDEPDETRPFEENSGQLELINTEEGAVGRAVFQPGWQWSKHVKPIAKTESCQGAHTGVVISGRLAVRMDDGTEDEYGPGTVQLIPPGHDAWVVGDEPCVIIDWTGMADYARRS